VSLTSLPAAPIARPDQLFIDGRWVAPTSNDGFDVIDSASEQVFFRVALAGADDLRRAIAAARRAFDEGPWPRMTPAQRAPYLAALAEGLRARRDDIAEIWPRQSGVLHRVAQYGGHGAAAAFDFYAGLADAYPFVREVKAANPADYGLLVREPVGVVGAIVPWNAPAGLTAYKVAPALIAGCTVVLKASPEAPGETLVLAEIAESIGLPPGVLNVLTADREVSEQLVTSPAVDKIAFTGSTAVGRRIATLLGDRIGRFTLELGGKSAAVILDDAD
jgi:aldehyde dehydrogenase (NAD+)